MTLGAGGGGAAGRKTVKEKFVLQKTEEILLTEGDLAAMLV